MYWFGISASALIISAGALLAGCDELAVSAECKAGGQPRNEIASVSSETAIYVQPEYTADYLVNEKATRALGEKHFHVLHGSSKIRLHCVRGEWAEVQMVEPEWLTFVRGWIPVENVRAISKDESGERIYVEEDFYWDSDTIPHKKDIVKIANRIARTEPNCDRLETGTLAKSSSRSSPSKPVYFLHCYDGARPFTVWFDLNE